MSSPDLPATTLPAELTRRLGSLLEHISAPVILLDGPSGAGKSTLADRMLAAWPGSVPAVLVRMDDIYPGWGGLDAASIHIHDELLLPRSVGKAARWQRHDWVTDTPAEWRPVAPGAPLIVEGCGALSRANAAVADLRLWLRADDSLRKSRALARDEGGFDAHWDGWQRQFEDFVARENPESLADLILDGTVWPPQLVSCR